MATESIFLLGRGLESPWIRAHPPTVFPEEDSEAIVPTPPARPRPHKRTSGPRFVEPCRLGAAERTALLSVLETEDLGDEDSRQIFLAALEYDLAGCRQLLDESTHTAPPPRATLESASFPSPSDATTESVSSHFQSDTTPGSAFPTSSPALLTLAHLAGELAQALAELPPTQRASLLGALEASDCLARGYGDAYLDSMRLELLHLKAAISPSGREPRSATAATSSPDQATPHPAPAPPPSPPEVPPEVRQFLRRAADAFNDCFEGEPRLAAEAPFPHLLRVLASVTGLALQEDEMTLREILASGH